MPSRRMANDDPLAKTLNLVQNPIGRVTRMTKRDAAQLSGTPETVNSTTLKEKAMMTINSSTKALKFTSPHEPPPRRECTTLLNSAIANGVVFFEKQTKFMNTCMLHMINNFMGVQFITYALAAATADHITDVTMRFGCDDAKLTLQCELPLYDETGNFRENVMHNYFSIVFGRDVIVRVELSLKSLVHAFSECAAVMMHIGNSKGGRDAHWLCAEFNDGLLLLKDSLLPEPEILAVEADSFDGMVEFALPKLVDLQPNAMFTVTANEDEMSVAIESARAFVDSLTSFKTKSRGPTWPSARTCPASSTR